ncbi:N-formylglutamate amidohydrolase [Aquamicrobium segne]|uniref:N-formylglutamate amidohydrolase n=1 Tax=Aquamicrobium segne TaxID=469547 RepID=A0ABW0H0D6_9HYPH
MSVLTKCCSGELLKVTSAAEDFSVISAFELQCAAEQRVPFVFSSPHSGRHYPERFLAMSRLDAHQVRRSEDCYVDELFGGCVGLGAPLLAANFPRAYLDANREPWELDPRMFVERLPPYCNIGSARVAGGLGTVPKLVGEGQNIYSGRLPLEEAVLRIEHAYKPYHDMLRHLIFQTFAKFNFAVLIDCHSMPAGVQSGGGGLRPDFIIGDCFGRSAMPELTNIAITLLSAMGYTVAYNKPYAGGFITEHYGQPMRGVHALQIEINRSLYMNEHSLEKTDGFCALAADLTQFCADLMALSDHHFRALPLAAE